MDLLESNMDNTTLDVGNYQFSSVCIDDNLGSSEYTLVTIAVDISLSVSNFKTELETALKTCVQACKDDPRGGRMMVRVVTFNRTVSELHGFKELRNISVDDYTNSLKCGGSTSLRDATANSCAAIQSFGRSLVASDYECNSILYVITDGVDIGSTLGTSTVAKTMKDAKTDEESVESFVAILVGINTDESGITDSLLTFKDEIGFDEFIDVKNADPKSLLNLAGSMSASISSTSQALGTGGPSQQIASLTI